MKKKLLYLFIGVFGFFFFSCLRVNAAQNVSLDFDKHEHFNYYYEFMHNTKFYQFVVGKGDGFGAYLKSYYDEVGEVYFAYASDILNFDVPNNAYYTIILTGYPGSLSYSNGSYCISRGDNVTGMSSSSHIHFLYYDIDMNFLSSSYKLNEQSNISNQINFCYSDFTYIMGSYYGRIFRNDETFSDYSGLKWGSGSTYDIRVTGVTINDTYYRISDIGTIDWFTNIFVYQMGGFISSVFSSDYSKYDLDDLGLGFISKNYVIGSRGDDDERLAGIYMCFSDSDSYNVSISVPDGFSSQSFNYDNRYYLIPNSLSCTDTQSLLYFSTSDVTTINFISYDVLQDTFSTNNIKMYKFQLHNANSVEVMSLKSVIGSDSLITDNFYIVSSSDNFSSNTVYYNPQCYSSYNAINNTDLEFTNINTGNTVTITPAEQQMILYSSNSAIDSYIEDNEVNLTSIISSAWTGSKTFISASYYILSMVTNLFIALPGEVKGVLVCVFTIGMVVILWKVFRS